MTTLVAPQVTDDLLAQYATLIYDVTGIRISAQKKALISNRLRRRLRETGIPTFEKYYTHLKALKQTDPEWDQFLQEITTHETYLFRDDANWTWFVQTYLREIAEEARLGKRAKSLRIWSAACSTGDEAFSLAACIAQYLPNFQQWKIKILGTDIGIDAVEQARQGVFGARAMRLVPAEIQTAWFTKKSDIGPWEAKPALKQLTEFRRHNLLHPLREVPFDVVFLKNVLIYFDQPSKAVVMENVRRVMKPGTRFIAGAAEGISELVKDLTRQQPWLFTST